MTQEKDLHDSPTRALAPSFLTESRLVDYNLPAKVMAGLEDAGFTYCTPIQAKVLPVSLTGKDVAGQAQTGTGKTAAFLVTLFTRLLGSSGSKGPRGLVLAPTRELAMQVYDEARVLGRHTNFSLALAIGGIDYKKQADIIGKGPDIIICTPGRIIDYMRQGIFKPGGIEVLVIDEADRLFDMGFIKDIRYLLRKLPPYKERQSMLFSATLSHQVLELTYEYMNEPEFISVTPQEVTVEGVDQSLFHVGTAEKLSLLLGLMEREAWTRVLIFLNTKAGVEWLANKLKANHLPAEGISGNLPQKERLRLMERFKDGRLKILVATDVASRGIHVEDISHVINYDLPQDPENYVHRIGRTARAGKTGKAISFACEHYVFHLEPIEKILGRKIPVVWPEEDWYKKDEARISRPKRPRPETISPKTPQQPPRLRPKTIPPETPQEPPRPRRETLPPKTPQEPPRLRPETLPPETPQEPPRTRAKAKSDAPRPPKAKASIPDERPLLNIFGMPRPILQTSAPGPSGGSEERKKKRRPRRKKGGTPTSSDPGPQASSQGTLDPKDPAET